MQIVFIHRSKAFLPELEAYVRYFDKLGIQSTVSDDQSRTIKADVEWYFMGIFPKRYAAITIHEYASASVPPVAVLKDRVKRKINALPDFRIFINEFVRQKMGFNDGVPHGIRDMGVEIPLLPYPVVAKEYDFIYTGSVARHRKLDLLFDCFTTGALRERSLLVLSNQYQSLADRLRSYQNIHFAGPVPHREVIHYLRKAAFGINYIINEPPFNYQTSTKLLEYAAAGLHIITNVYPWVKTFEQQTGGLFFKTDDSFSNFTWEQIINFHYERPDLTGWSWEEQIRKSGVVEFINAKCKV